LIFSGARHQSVLRSEKGWSRFDTVCIY